MIKIKFFLLHPFDKAWLLSFGQSFLYWVGHFFISTLYLAMMVIKPTNQLTYVVVFLRYSAGVPTYILFCQYKTCLKCLYHSATKFFLVYPISICSKWFLHCLEGNYNPFQIAFSTKHLILLAVTLNSPVSKSSILAILHKFPGSVQSGWPCMYILFLHFLNIWTSFSCFEIQPYSTQVY